MPTVQSHARELKLLWVGAAAETDHQGQERDEPNPWDCEISVASTLYEASATLRKDEYDVVVTQLSLPDTFGFDGVIALHAAAPQVPIVVLTEPQDEQFAVQALNLGAQEYLVEGSYRTYDLRQAIERAIERKAIEYRLQELTQLDTLTGLRNRALLRDRFCHLLVRARREQMPFTFAVIALQGAQHHSPGDSDRAMRAISVALAQQVRASDTLSRLAYDRFGLLLENLEPDALKSVLDRLTQPLRPLCPPNNSLRVGHASFPQDGDSVDGLMQTAQSRIHR